MSSDKVFEYWIVCHADVRRGFVAGIYTIRGWGGGEVLCLASPTFFREKLKQSFFAPCKTSTKFY
jgi:hypothetical protein